jgi:hypothetical protein
MRERLCVLMVALAACGQTSAGGDDTAGTVDALGTGSGSGSGSASHPGVTDTITCQTHTRVFTPTTPGARFEVRTYFALVDGISPTDDYTVELCNYQRVPDQGACPTGYTCADSGTTLPDAASTCSWSHRVGSFVNGQLYITCGSGSTNYDANNNVMATSESRYQIVRVHH